MRTLLIFALLAAPAHGADPAFPFAVQQKTLDNGLLIYAIPCDSPGIVAYFSVVRTGSRNEIEPGKSGFAHFFEHMMFRGTPTYPETEYNRVLKLAGADSNAWTWRDQTVYFAIAAAASLPKLVEIEADRFQNLEYGEAEFQKEARAVLGEYNKSSADPQTLLRETLANAAFDTHPYEHTTIGFLKDVEAMPQQFAYSRTFFERWYRPDNVVIIVAGDVDPAQLFAEAERRYGPWKKGATPPTIPAEPPQTEEKRVDLKWPNETLPQLMIGWKVPAFSTANRDSAALDVLADVVFAERAPLYRKLVIDEQKVDTLRASAPQNVDPWLFTARARVKAAADLPYVEAAIHDAIAKIARDGVAQKTLEEVKRRARYSFAGGLSTAQGVASNAAWYVSLTGRIDSINAYFEQIAAVSSDDLKRVAAQYFVQTGRTVITLVPEVKK